MNLIPYTDSSIELLKAVFNSLQWDMTKAPLTPDPTIGYDLVKVPSAMFAFSGGRVERLIFGSW